MTSRILLLFAPAIAFAALPVDNVEIVTTELVPFVSNGDIELRESFGALKIEGWDQPEVEVTVRRSTEKKYDIDKQLEMRNELEKIIVTTRHDSDARLIIETQKAPRRLLRRNSGLKLEYIIRAPYRSNLIVRHGMGEVSVINVTGNADVSTGVGEVDMRLPGQEKYLVDARARTGEVSSDFRSSGCSQEAHRLFVRVGVGDISIRKLGGGM